MMNPPPLAGATRRRLLPPVQILLVLAMLLAAAPAAAAPVRDDGADPFAKVDKKVLDQLDAKDEATFFVLLRDKATLAGASAVRQHGQRAAFVRQQLTDTATRSQSGLRALLDARHADYRPFWIVNTIQVTGGRALLKEIASRSDVDRVVPRRTYQLVKPRKGATRATVQSIEWNIDRIRAPEVWSTFGDRGDGIVVASIDSGVQFDHPALVRQYRGNRGNGQFDHNYNWFDPAGVCPDPAPCDNIGHGTHVMGIMVGDDGDPGANQIGVAPHARWITAKGCETTGCSEGSLLASGEWMIAPTDLAGQNPRPDLAPNVVSNSWGGGPGDPFYQGIVDAWAAAGIFPAFAAGNAGPDCGTAGSPGDYVNAYAVGNHDVANAIDTDSSRGPSQFGGETKPNISAPGDDVRSSVPGGGYDSLSGTSMATPHVSGTVALLWSAAPALVGDLATTRQLLDDSAIDVADSQCGGSADDNNVWGEGRLDAFTAVQQAPRGSTGTLAGTVTDSAGAAIAGATVRVTGLADRSTTTAADGSWRLVLSVGAYDVAVSHFGHLTQTLPGVQVREGETTTLDVALAAAPTHAVSGHVRDDGGSPVAGATVTLAGTPLPPAATGAGGAYGFAAVPEGSYDVDAEAGGCLGTQRQQLVVDGDESLDFTLASRGDGFGNVCRPSSFSFIDTGTVLNLSGDDQSVAVGLPFPLTFYGQTYRTAYVSTNGNLNFLAPDTTFGNTALPDAGEPNAAVYPLWDDLTVDGSALVGTELVGSAPNRALAVEWRDVRFIGDTTRVTFEVVLQESGRIRFQYKDLGGTTRGQGDSATVGIEDQTGTDALQYSFGQAVLHDGTAITFRRPNAAFAQGMVSDANDGQAVAGALVRALRDGSPVAETSADQTGFYRLHLPLGTFTLEASAPSYTAATARVTLDREEAFVAADLSLATGRAEVAPAAIQPVVPVGESRTRQLSLRNSGGAALTWSIEERAGGTAQDVPWLSASPSSGTLAPGGAQPVAVLVDTTGLSPGVHDADLVVVVSNSGRRPEAPVAVRLIVPAYQVGVNAGGGSYVDGQGDAWRPDQAFAAGSFGYLDNGRSRRVRSTHAIDGTLDDTLYQSARENAFEYRFDGVPQGVYEVDLRFAELQRQKPNTRLFDVIVEGQLLLPAQDIALEAGSFHADDHAFLVPVTDGQLNVRLVTRTGFGRPIINALRVTERPDR